MTKELPARIDRTAITAGNAAPIVPAPVAASGTRPAIRFLEFLSGQPCNPHTRRAYGRAVADSLACRDAQRVASLPAGQPLHGPWSASRCTR